MHCNVAWLALFNFGIYAEIKLNCVKLNNIEISIHNFPSPHLTHLSLSIVLFLSDLWLMHSIIFTHCMALMCGLNACMWPKRDVPESAFFLLSSSPLLLIEKHSFRRLREREFFNSGTHKFLHEYANYFTIMCPCSHHLFFC